MGSTPNQHRTASDGQTGLLLHQKLVIKTEQLRFIASYQHSFMIKTVGLAVNYSVPGTKHGPCRMGEGHCPFRIYSLLLQLHNTLHATTHKQGKCVHALHLDILLISQNFVFSLTLSSMIFL